MAKVPSAVEISPKISTAWVGRTSGTDDRQTPLFSVKVRLFCTFDLDLESLFLRSQVDGHFQFESNMIQSCLFSVTGETKSVATWKIYTNEFAAKTEFFFSNEGKEPHIYANSAEGGRGYI